MKVCLFIILLSVMAIPVHADPCDKDRAITCGEVSAGDGKVFDCLIGRKDKLTPECSQAVDRAEALASAAMAACKDEAQRWCAQYTGTGHDAVLSCLKSHKNDIGGDCKHKYRQYKSYGFDVRL